MYEELKTTDDVRAMASDTTLNSWVNPELAEDEKYRLNFIFGEKNKRADFRDDDGHNKTASNILKSWCMHYKEMLDNRVGIILRGNVGTGKSFYASCIAKYIMCQRKSCMVATIPYLINRKLNGNSDYKEAWEWNFARECPVLVIDDFGVERISEFVLEQTYDLIEARNQLVNGVTIITTNLLKEDMDNIAKKGDMMQDRIISRINELCPIDILLLGEDNRKNNASILKKIYTPILTQGVN